MAPLHFLKLLAPLVLTLLHHAIAHSPDDQAPLIPPNADWATRHMAEEHHITSFDATSFFHLHDFDASRTLDPSEIRRTYGLEDVDTAGHISEGQKRDVVRKVLELFDTDRSGAISVQEWEEGQRAGKRLPDFGFGAGHHGDDEYEYEIHHFEKFHDENTREEDLTHPEDIAHFRRHDAEDDEAERQVQLDRMSIVEVNIPAKFRRPS